MSQLMDWASQNKAPAAEAYETPDEKLARLETENAALKARAEDAERGWHDALSRSNSMALNSAGRWEARSDHAVLVSLANLAEETLAVQRHILSTLKTNAESRNVVEIDSNGSAGRIKVRVRCTGETLADAHADALEQFAQAMAEVEAGQVNGWQQTVEMLQAKGGEAA